MPKNIRFDSGEYDGPGHVKYSASEQYISQDDANELLAYLADMS